MDSAEYERRRQEILGKAKPYTVREIAPTCSCGLPMVKRFGKGEYWCPICAKTQKDIHQEVLEVKAVRRENKEARAEVIRAKILAHPFYGFAVRLTQKILEEHGYTHNVIFRNIQGADQYKLDNGTHQIRYGYSCVKHITEKGYVEYPKSYHYLWNGHKDLTGKKAVWALVIHETAHAIQVEAGGRWYGSAHNGHWAKAVEELQILYPFEEVQNV